jgi:hypothetical protein
MSDLIEWQHACEYWQSEAKKAQARIAELEAAPLPDEVAAMIASLKPFPDVIDWQDQHSYYSLPVGKLAAALERMARENERLLARLSEKDTEISRLRSCVAEMHEPFPLSPELVSLSSECADCGASKHARSVIGFSCMHNKCPYEFDSLPDAMKEISRLRELEGKLRRSAEHIIDIAAKDRTVLRARIAELEAERDRLRDLVECKDCMEYTQRVAAAIEAATIERCAQHLIDEEMDYAEVYAERIRALKETP